MILVNNLNRETAFSLNRIWKPAIILTALAFAIPILTIAGFILQPSAEIWQHLVDTVLFNRGYLCLVDQCLPVSRETVLCMGTFTAAGDAGLHYCLYLHRYV